MSLPIINNATVAYTQYGNIAITMNNGYVFYDKNAYANLTDRDGNPRKPTPEEIYYSNYIVFPRSVTNEEIESRVIVVLESDKNNILAPDEISAEEFMILVEEAL